MTDILYSTLKPELFSSIPTYPSFFSKLALAYPDLLFDQIWLHVFLIFAFALFNGFFVAAEVAFIKLRAAQIDQLDESEKNVKPVSYTHLTLPTIYSV